MIRSAVKGVEKVRVVKLVLRVARVNGRALERDVVGAINIGLRLKVLAITCGYL